MNSAPDIYRVPFLVTILVQQQQQEEENWIPRTART